MASSLNGTGITFSDSTAQSSARTGPGCQVFTSTGTFTVPAGITSVRVRVYGGGGGGDNQGYGQVGGAGGFIEANITGLTPGASITATVGAGGTPNGLGGTGGTSSFGSYATATGGNASGTGSGTYGYVGVGSTTGTIIQRSRGNTKSSIGEGYSFNNTLPYGSATSGGIGLHNCGFGGGGGGGGMSGGSGGGGNQAQGAAGRAFGPGSDGSAGGTSVVGGAGGAGGVVVFW